MIAAAIKFRDLGYVIVILALLAWCGWQRAEINGVDAKIAKATLKARERAEALSNELIIAQAASLAVTEKKVVEYVDRIRTVRAPDTACAADDRMRLGNHGVRDILGQGRPAQAR